jgi:CoA:oxalate CoA-transferase
MGGVKEEQGKERMNSNEAPKGPLQGILVIDLSRILAGPYCTMVLADLGARVIKVEQPEGDDARQYGPFVGGRSAYFASVNHAKQSIALDLKAPADRAIFERLLARADVLVENYRPGTMEKLGFGWDALHAKYPRLIYASASGFGHTGPDSKRAAYDMVVQAMGGIMSLTGHPGSPPTRVGTSVGDITAALFTAIGVNAALYNRAGTGQGIKVDVSMLDCQVAILENAIARYFASGEVPEPMGARHPSITPFEAFATREGYIVIAAGNDGLFRKLAEALGRPHLADDARFITNPDRTRNHGALKDEIEAALSFHDAPEWLRRIDAVGVPCAPINNVAEAVAHRQIAARNMIVTEEDSSADSKTGPLKMAGNPIKLSGFPDPATRPPAPALDADREAILRELGV